jgi:hypothetical protein
MDQMAGRTSPEMGEREMGLEIARWMVALGSVGAAVGLTVYGIATSTLHPMQELIQPSIILMVGGLILFVIGMVAHHRMDETDSSADL